MSRQTTSDEMVRYFLGDLTVEEQDRLEELYFEDDAALDQLLVAESRLIEGYVSGELQGAEREKFRQNYLTTPERQRRVELVEQLRLRANAEAAETERAPEKKSKPASAPWWQKFLHAIYPQTQAARAAFAFGAVAVVFASALLFNQTRELRTRLGTSEQERAALRNRVEETEQRLGEQQARETELAQQLSREQHINEELSATVEGDTPTPDARARPPVPSLDLSFASEVQTLDPRTPHVSSPGQPRRVRLTVPKEAELVRLRVRLAAAGYRSYTLTLKRADGTQVVARTGLTPRFARNGQAITTHIDASLVPRGEYELVLSGRRDDGTVVELERYTVTVENSRQ